jgi:hypothetical protein
MTHSRSVLSNFLNVAVLLVIVGGSLLSTPFRPAAAAAPQAAPISAQQAVSTTNTISLSVVSARTEPKWGAPLGDPNPPGITQGDSITTYQFIINQDNTGDPTQSRMPDCYPYLDPPDNTQINPDYPSKCNWPSIEAQPSNSPIVTQGDRSILNDTTTLTLPDGKYLISVLADGFKIDGQWFTLPMAETVPGVADVHVEMQPLPLATATIRITVFEDISPVNSAPDIPAEHGLAGFVAHIFDALDETTTDVYGNPLCTQYYTDTTPGPNFGEFIYEDGAPVPIDGSGGQCVSDENGDIVIPNLGPNRWAVSVVPPDGTDWQLTTTLEGNKDWDTWVQEGATGYDTEFVTAGEPFPFTIFGFVRPTDLFTDTSVTGEIKGVVAAAQVYVPYNGGLPYQGQLWGGLSGAKLDHIIANPWVALSDLQNGDTAVWIGQGNPDGSFDIPHVPDGDYTLTYWDAPNTYILDLVNVTVSNGEVVDLGNLFLTGWFTTVTGHVFVDDNENGKMDPGELGLEGYPVVLRRRENTMMDRGSIATLTDPSGYYIFENLYPLTQWLVLESYTDNYYTTGVTWQASNQPEETTILGNGVDVNVLPVIGQSGRLDWGVKQYAPGTNGGIVGTVSYDTTRNELDPRFAAVENWQPGISNLTVNLYATVKDANGDFVTEADGSLKKGNLLNTTTTETWHRPQDCQARDVDGNPVDQLVLPPASGGYDCLEAPLTGVQFESDFATVDGNYGFGTIFTPTYGITNAVEIPMPPGDYLVEVQVPNDAFGRPLYKVTKEEDINIFSGDVYSPTFIAGGAEPDLVPPYCAGALHTVDVAGVGTDGPDAVFNPSFADAGGSPYEGQARPLCDVKLVTVTNQRSVAPTFNFFTDVPLPGRWFGIVLDDLNLSTNPQDLLFGEKAGVPNSPVGVYDFSNRLLTTVSTDPNGLFDILLPSTSTINCPSPSGVCANVYRIVGNDPGQPGRVNSNYNPQFRTISANFEVFPGVIIPADLAPTQIGVTIQAPGSQIDASVACLIDPSTPQLFSVNKPYFSQNGSRASRTITITGLGFGDVQGTGSVKLDNNALAIDLWSDRQIKAVIPVTPPNLSGSHQLKITADNGQTLINGLTIHIIGGNYRPTVLEVGPGKTYGTIQAALDAAANINRALIVVYPGETGLFNPRGVYYENLVMYSPVKLQGIGPGGVYTDTNEYVPGSIVSGLGFAGDTDIATNWRTLVGSLTWVGNQEVYEGAVITVFALSNNQFTQGYPATIDGLSLEGGDQQGFPNNINPIGGGNNGQPANVVVQGGGVFVNGYAHYLRITNNILQSNGGAYGGAIRLGTPNLPADDPNKNAHNDHILISNNFIKANGGTNLAGGIGIFEGSALYQVSFNDICGNFSAEYGGGISHYGYSPQGKINNNRIYFNRSYDEGGGVFIAGELPADPALLSHGSGPVDIYNNIIQANLANDDGGGIRFLMAGNYPFNVYNNMIVNNISTHEGGGISLNDAPNVRVYNNTIMKNITTATAITSTGLPAPAGLSSSRNSDLLQATLPGGAPVFSNPLLFNNIFWDNRAGSWNGAGVAGIGLAGDPNPINLWDLGVSDLSGVLEPTYSILNTDNAGWIVPSSTNLVGVDPAVVSTYDTSVTVLPWRGNPHFVGVIMVAVEVPPQLMGNYHLSDASPAIDMGTAGKNGISAPLTDIDGDTRPAGAGYDIGADEIGSLGGILSVIPGINAINFYKLFIPMASR